MARPFPTDMPDEEVEALAAMFQVPFIQVKGIVLLAELRMKGNFGQATIKANAVSNEEVVGTSLS